MKRSKLKHRRKHSKKSSRRNPFPKRTNAKRRHRSRRRSNPSLSLKSVANKAFIVNALLTAGGFVAGVKGTKYLLMIPGLASMNRFVGVLHVLIGGLVAAKAKNPKAKSVGLGLAAAGAFDLIAKNVTALGLPTLLGMDSEVAGDYMGETYLPGQTEVLGETYLPGRTEVLGEEFAGDDIYADV